MAEIGCQQCEEDLRGGTKPPNSPRAGLLPSPLDFLYLGTERGTPALAPRSGSVCISERITEKMAELYHMLFLPLFKMQITRMHTVRDTGPASLFSLC